MPTVPFLEKQVQQQGYRPAELSLPKGYGSTVPDTGMPKLLEAAQGVAEQAKQRADTTIMIENMRKLDDWDAENIFNPNGGALTKKGKDAFNVSDIYGNQFKQFTDEIYNNLSNQEQRDAFMKMAYQRHDTLLRTLAGHERGQMDQYSKDNTNAAISSNVNRASLYYNIPDVVDKAITDARTAVALQSQNDGDRQEVSDQKQLIVESSIRMAQLRRMADADPKAAIEYYQKHAARFTADDLGEAQRMITPVERKYKATQVARQALGSYQVRQTRDDIINYVMYELEGGDKVVTDNDGGTAKFGINHKHNKNPDGTPMTPEQVAALTPEQARAHKKTHYWDAMKIDDLPADMRLIAYDAAIQHGADADTKKMIEEANGDPRALIEIRRDYYIKLAKQNPTQNGPQLEGWMNRLAKLSAQVDLMRGQQPSMEEMNARIDSMTDDLDVAADAKQLIKAQFDAREADQKAAQMAASDEAWSYVGSGMRVPASVESRMKPKEVYEMREAMNKGMTPDPVVYNDIRQRVLTGQKLYMQDANGKTVEASLQDFRWVLGNKYDEIAAIKSDPAKLVNARSTDEIIKSGYGRLLGKNQPESKADYEKVELFRQIIQQEINMVQAGGKVATPDDVQRIVDRNLLQVGKGSFFGGKTLMFERDQNKPFEIDGIPSDAVYTVKSKSGPVRVEYSDLVKTLIARAEKTGMRVNPENLKKLYEQAVKDGKLGVGYKK